MALVVAVLLVLARVVGLGFLANFLSRTVLVGFLTGVGITVAIGQLGDLLGVDPGSGDAPERLVHVLSELPHAHLPTVLVGGAVILVVLAGRLVDRRVPVALFAVVAAIVGRGRARALRVRRGGARRRCRRACQGSCCPRSPRPTSSPRSRWPSRWPS